LRNELVEEHINLARGFARRYSRRGVALEDLEQVAQISLIGAVERFDPAVGVRFQTYAGRTVDGELKRHFRDKAWAVRVPRRYQDLGVAIRTSLDTLSKELGRTPTIVELAEAVGAETDEVLAALRKAFTADSIDAPTPGETAPPSYDCRASSAQTTSSRGSLMIESLVSGLLTVSTTESARSSNCGFLGSRGSAVNGTSPRKSVSVRCTSHGYSRGR
ncbi:UNVERIFIED_CONTAM: hypothetical protein GTU68_013793, partial [Idotea baltica]|nr:hypothetical protein [Idotea baltica]